MEIVNKDLITEFSIECQNGDEVFEIPPYGIAQMFTYGATLYFESLVRYGCLVIHLEKGVNLNRLRTFSDN